MANRVKRENYITVQGFMLTDLKLKGNELLVYACIYGFSQAENQVFNGSLQYLADWTNSTKQGVIKSLKSLEEKGFIIKKEHYINGVKFCEYQSTEFNGVLNKVEQGSQQSLMGGIKQSLPNNIEQDISIDTKSKKGKFAPPTVEEVQAYCLERKNGIDAECFVDFYTAKGWKVGKEPMKDWKACVRTWEQRRRAEKKEEQKGKHGFEQHEYSDGEINSLFTDLENLEI